jgi:hypothetical protein
VADPAPDAEVITPDTGDWTWVLDRQCPECGLDVRTLDREQIADVLRSNAMAWADLLDADPQLRRARPRPGRWSTLEYACHVRDVYRVFDERLVLMLEQRDPRYPNWDQDATAIEAGYRHQLPDRVAGELLAAADVLADRFDDVRGAQWQRTGTRSDGARFTVESFARYFIHDPVHHIWDVTMSEERR